MTKTVHIRMCGSIWLLLPSLVALLALPLPASAHEDSVFISIRVYDGVDPADLAELERLTIEGFVPIIGASDGFVAYYVVYPDDGTGASISIFETREQALASNEQVRDYIAENVAPLLPNAPRIVEGAVDIGFVEMLDGMADGGVSSLHASVRIYDGFNSDDLNEFVRIVEDGFLPISRESDGFFGYYLMNDGAETVAAISIFDSEASALASIEEARDFVAENLTAYLPEAPSITSGRVGVAVLADINDAANLIDERVFVSVRVYEGLDPADQAEIVRRTAEGFLPIMRGSDGFVGYYLLPAGDMLAAVSLFDSAEQAAASNEAARDFVAENLAPFLPNAPTIVEGGIDVMYLDQMLSADVGSLNASLRIYKVGNMQDIEESNRLVKAHLLPALVEAGGLFSYFSLNDGVDTVVGLNVYTSEAKARAANDIAAAFVAEHMMDWMPEDPLRVTGPLGIAALRDIGAGANLVKSHRQSASAFASVRVYDGVNPMDQDEIIQKTARGFLPIMNDSDGFIAYFLLPQGDRLAAISAFESVEQAAASNDAARDFVAENLAPLLPNRPLIVQGPMDTGFFARLDETMAIDQSASLYASLRIYDEVDLTQRAQTTAAVHEIFLPTLREAEGFWGYVRLHDGESRSVALSIYDNESNALAANEKAAAFVAEHLTDRPDQVPLRVSGQLGVAALADVDMGANLIADEMKSDSAFASIRVYDGVDPSALDTYIRLANEGFLPIIRESDGFIGFYLMLAGERHASVSIFETAAQAEASRETARGFIAEHLAPLIPHPPMIVEGAVEVTFLADADEIMMADSGSSPQALLAIYDGFDVAHLDETVDLVESIFLPAVSEAGGLISYYGISDGVDKAIALRIMDSAESLARGSEIAADFVAEYMGDWLPEDPLTVSGQLIVASLADIDAGANLVEYKKDDAVFASVRVYAGVDPADQAEIASLTADGFLPIMRESDGFVGYFLLPAGDMLAAISLFDSAELASASNEAARAFVVESLAPLLPNAPMIFEGSLSINSVAAHREDDEIGDLFASIRFYDGFDLSHFDEANDLAKSQLLPALQELGGLFAQFAFNDGQDTVVGISIFDSEEASLAANEVGKAFTIEYLADWAPNPPTGVAGKLAIAAHAEVHRGDNLVGARMTG